MPKDISSSPLDGSKGITKSPPIITDDDLAKFFRLRLETIPLRVPGRLEMVCSSVLMRPEVIFPTTPVAIDGDCKKCFGGGNTSNFN
jgi:hypothetical protein